MISLLLAVAISTPNADAYTRVYVSGGAGAIGCFCMPGEPGASGAAFGAGLEYHRRLAERVFLAPELDLSLVVNAPRAATAALSVLLGLDGSHVGAGIGPLAGVTWVEGHAYANVESSGHIPPRVHGVVGARAQVAFYLGPWSASLAPAIGWASNGHKLMQVTGRVGFVL